MKKSQTSTKVPTLVKYNAEYIPVPMGLANAGALCYFNTMLQCLMSCSAFNQRVIDNYDVYRKKAAGPESNSLGLLYYKLITTQDATGIASTINVEIIKELIRLQKAAGHGDADTFNLQRQDCVREGLTCFIDAMGGVSDLFAVRYKNVLKCGACGEECGGRANAPSDCTIQLFKPGLNTKERIENHIRYHSDIPLDFKCVKCDSQNTDGEDIITQEYFLVRLSEIIVLVFNKYDIKTVKFFPPTLMFESKTGPLNYKLIAQAMHLGASRFGGHYVARCVRPTGIINFDDANHTAISENEMKPNRSSYVVFYCLM